MVGELKAKLSTIAITGIQFNAGKIKLLVLCYREICRNTVLQLIFDGSRSEEKQILLNQL
jgi:hypothetical protein